MHLKCGNRTFYGASAKFGAIVFVKSTVIGNNAEFFKFQLIFVIAEPCSAGSLRENFEDIPTGISHKIFIRDNADSCFKINSPAESALRSDSGNNRGNGIIIFFGEISRGIEDPVKSPAIVIGSYFRCAVCKPRL